MSVPNVVMIDTCIFDESTYNFDSVKMRAFIEAAKARKLTLLLPDPTSREIRRHIKDRANDATEALRKALDKAKSKAPFLRKWEDCPTEEGISTLNWELQNITDKELDQFLKNFKVVKLDYTGIKIVEIMDWYDRQQAPFGQGKNRKEFPDAFAFAIVLQYAQNNKCSVAIVSGDSDFRKAAEGYSEILHFDSLEAFTEALIADDTRVEAVRNILSTDTTHLKEAIADEFPNCGFYQTEYAYGDIENVQVESVAMREVNIIALGDMQCTIAFSAVVEYFADIEYGYPESAVADGSDYLYQTIPKEAWTSAAFAAISGIAKLRISDDWKVISYVDLIVIDDEDVEVKFDLDEHY